MRFDHDQPANIQRILANLPTGPAPGAHHGCCGDPPSRGRLCPYHQGYEDGWEAATQHITNTLTNHPQGAAPGAATMTDNYRIDRLEHAIHQLIDALTAHQPEWADTLRQGSLLDIHTIIEQRIDTPTDG